MMLLCDCVNLNTSLLTPNMMNVIRQLGSIYEIEITMARDLQRWQPSLKELNLYTYWLLKNSIFSQGTTQIHQQSFIKHIKAMLLKKQLHLQPLLDEKLRTLCEITSEVIRTFYNFNEKTHINPHL